MTTDEHSALLRRRSGPAPPAVRVVALCVLLLVGVELGATLLAVPATRIMEAALCARMRLGLPTPNCKAPDVQGRLAVLPPLLAAVPYGVLADRHGRRPALLLAALGIFLCVAYRVLVLALTHVVPVWAVLFAGLCTLVGDGPSLLVAVVLTTVADTVPAAQRTAVLFGLSAVSLAAQMLSSPLSALLMARDVWLPM